MPSSIPSRQTTRYGSPRRLVSDENVTPPHGTPPRAGSSSATVERVRSTAAGFACRARRRASAIERLVDGRATLGERIANGGPGRTAVQAHRQERAPAIARQGFARAPHEAVDSRR